MKSASRGLKDSGVSWLGSLPEEWEAVPLKQRTSLVSRGRSPDYSDDDSGVPIINQACIYWDGIRFDNVKWQRRETLSGARGRLRHGDLLINSTGTGTLGRAATLDQEGEFLADSHVTVVRTTADASTSFIRYVLQTETYQGYVYSVLAPGATNQIELSREGLRRTPFPMPSLREQVSIAEYLDRKSAAIDALIAKKLRLIELLQEKRQALITQAVTKGLDPNVPMKDSGVGWIGTVPKHWSVRRIKYVCRLESGHTPSRTEESYWVPEECVIPWVSLNDTKSLDAEDYIDDTAVKISALGMANSSAHMIPPGAVVFNRDGARVGLAAITTRPMAVSQHIIAWVCGPLVNSLYLLHGIYAMQDELVRVTAGATIPTIGMGDVRELAIPVPPADEQLQIVLSLNAARGRLAAALHAVEKQIACIREYRQALITAAVTGKIDVSDEAA